MCALVLPWVVYGKPILIRAWWWAWTTYIWGITWPVDYEEELASHFGTKMELSTTRVWHAIASSDRIRVSPEAGYIGRSILGLENGTALASTKITLSYQIQRLVHSFNFKDLWTQCVSLALVWIQSLYSRICRALQKAILHAILPMELSHKPLWYIGRSHFLPEYPGTTRYWKVRVDLYTYIHTHTTHPYIHTFALLWSILNISYQDDVTFQWFK